MKMRFTQVLVLVAISIVLSSCFNFSTKNSDEDRVTYVECLARAEARATSTAEVRQPTATPDPEKEITPVPLSNYSWYSRNPGGPPENDRCAWGPELVRFTRFGFKYIENMRLERQRAENLELQKKIFRIQRELYESMSLPTPYRLPSYLLTPIPPLLWPP